MDSGNNRSNGISRRSALKRMGLLAVGAAMGMPVFASCDSEKKKRIIFYFTATGNSLYVARQLADESTELLSIPQIVKQGRYEFEADEIGMVYPIYGQMPPNMVRNFIQRARLTASYKFAVLTYGNMQFAVVGIWDEVSRKAGNAFDYITSILMVDNWLPNFDMNEQIKIDKHIPESLERIQTDLAAQRHFVEATDEQGMQLFNRFIKDRGLDPQVGYLVRSEQYFVVGDACIGCGVCTEVCPHGNYELTSTGVKTEEDCDFCFACIHNCPQKAIKFAELPDNPFLAHGEKNPNARYRNEHVSLWSIKESNRQ